MKRILMLGAGRVSRPAADYLLSVPDFHLTVADLVLANAEKTLGGNPRGKAVALSADNVEELDRMAAEHDLVVSLLPREYDTAVADACLKNGKSLVTANYVSPGMRERDQAAGKKGLTFLEEVGVDPGIDHMSAMKVIREVEKKGGRIMSFRSYCGGLPAPDAVTTPWKYKFSWNPRGVFQSSRRDAKYLENGKVVEIPGEELFRHYHTMSVGGVGELEAYPNRDCLAYIDLYGLKHVKTMYRGTLRYPGWCDLLYKVRKLGLMELDEMDGLKGLTYAQFTARLVKADEAADIKAAAAKYVDEPADSEVMSKLEWLGLFDTGDTLDVGKSTPLDVFVALLLHKLTYAPGERDMLVMVHQFEVEYPAENRRERITSELVDFGIPNGDTSMARLVGLPCAVAARLILEKKITRPGVLVPVLPEIYEPILAELSIMGIAMKERVEAL